MVRVPVILAKLASFILAVACFERKGRIAMLAGRNSAGPTASVWRPMG